MANVIKDYPNRKKHTYIGIGLLCISIILVIVALTVAQGHTPYISELIIAAVLAVIGIVLLYF